MTRGHYGGGESSYLSVAGADLNSQEPSRALIVFEYPEAGEPDRKPERATQIITNAQCHR